MRRKSSKLQLQKRFIFDNSARFTPVRREEIYDSEHIFGQLEPIFDYLKNFDAYHNEGINADGGAVLCGPPGMGKTMFARYIAGESKARFINVREFPVEIKNGTQRWQPQDVSALFRFSAELVRKNDHPVVLFIDQFDNFLGSTSDSVRNQFELELDGFLARGSGIFLLTTSQSMPNNVVGDVQQGIPFGGALFRRGRIGIHIPFIYPDFTQSTKLLSGFLGEHPHADNIDVDNLVYLLESPTSADLKYAVSEARQLARREMAKKGARGAELKKTNITQTHLVEVFLSKTLDQETGHTLTEEERYEICVHEIGHYIVARALGIAARFASVRPGFRSLGITFAIDDDKTRSHETLRRQIAFSSGSWEAERLCGISANTGKSSDVEMANDIAEELTFHGERRHLRPYGLLRVDRALTEERAIQMSQKTISALEKDIARIMQTEERRARSVLRFFGRKLIEKAAYTLKRSRHGVMLQKELDELFEPKLSMFHARYKVVDHLQSAT